MKKNTFAYRIIRSVLWFCAGLFLLVFLVSYSFTRHSLRKTARENAIDTGQKTIHAIEQVLRPVEIIPRNLAWMLGQEKFTPEQLPEILENILRHNENIYGTIIAYEPSFFQEHGRYYAPYAYFRGDSICSTILGDEDYEYFYMDWYQIPKMIGKPYWSEPYYDEGGGNILMSTYSVPFYTHRGELQEFAGVVTVDISLEWLTRIVASIQIFETGYAYLLSRNGVFLTHPDSSYIMNQSIFSLASETGQLELRELGREMIHGKTLFTELNLPERGRYWTYYAPLPSNGWSLGVVYPHREMYASLHRMNLMLILLIVSGLAMLSYFTIRIIEKLTRPLKQFAGSARIIAEGNFQAMLPEISTKDEMKELRDSFAYMQKALSEYMDHLKETTSAKEKIESELRIASEIQMGMIPHIFPPFPDLPQIDLYAILKPAKEVGGDLYDFFVTDENKLCFAIGDVSGKGIPASLFMAVTRTLLRSISDKEKSPSVIVSTLNKSLSYNNESSMFVTLFLGILDLSNGHLRYANAGHNPPVLLKKHGELSFFEKSTGIPAGLFEDAEYPESEKVLEKGDKLFLYTDGVTEAENANNLLFSDHLLLSILDQNKEMAPNELIHRVETALTCHVNGFVQSDDITMMSIAYNES